MAINTFERLPSVVKRERIIEFLVKPTTLPEISLALFISEPHLRSIIRDMHEKKLVYIASYTNKPVANQRGILRKEWMAGNLPDCERPKPIPDILRSKKEYAAIKADPEKLAARKRRDHIRYLIRKLKANPDPSINWVLKKS